MSYRMAILATAALLWAAGILFAQNDGRPALVTLAILPFENLTGNTDDSWLSRGFAEELTAALSGVPSVRVIERNQLDRVLREQDFQLSDVSDPSNGIRLGKLLAVQKLLLGSYQVVDGYLRATARLVDTETGMVDPQSSLTAEDRVENIFDVYEQLTRKLLASFQVRVSAGQSGRLQAFKLSGTRSLKAYESYLKGMDYYAAGDEQSLKEARSHFKKALGYDKKFTAARQALANTYFRMNDLDDAIDEYEKIVKKGVDVDDRLYITLGLFYRAAGKSSKARENYRAAISLNPSSAEGYHNLAILSLGEQQPAEALDDAKHATALDPDNPEFLYTLAKTYVALGRTYDALQALGRALENGFQDRNRLDGDREWNPIRFDGKFRDLLEDYFD